MTKRGNNSLKQKARQLARREGIPYSAALARLSTSTSCHPKQTECGMESSRVEAGGAGSDPYWAARTGFAELFGGARIDTARLFGA
ncbi:hypothetical protein, partial [Streptomyces griseofuscus]|uniref:hypothetical protein n=1 Tax=Streptomyces griseofuscus TaxID=146922 RepID=UPI0033E0DA32